MLKATSIICLCIIFQESNLHRVNLFICLNHGKTSIEGFFLFFYKFDPKLEITDKY